MARMRDDRDRAALLSRMLDSTYGSEEAGVTSAPAGEMDAPNDQVRRSRQRIDPQTDADYERMYGPEDEMEDELGPRPHMKQQMPDSGMQAQGEQMVPVPKRIVDTVMASMMKSASANSIGRSRGADGQGYQQMAQNDGFDPAMARKMQFMSGASDTTSNPEDWQNDRYYQGSREGAQRSGVVGSRDNDNLKKRARNDR